MFLTWITVSMIRDCIFPELFLYNCIPCRYILERKRPIAYTVLWSIGFEAQFSVQLYHKGVSGDANDLFRPYIRLFRFSKLDI